MKEFTPYLVISNEDFKKNAAIDLSEYTKTLQNATYCPWGVALHYLREYNPNLAVAFEENEQGQPYFLTENGAYLKPYVFDKQTGKRTPAIFFPVRNNKRQAVADVMMDTLGNQMQRAIAKVIAQEVGLAWSLYSRIDESMLELEEASPRPAQTSGAKALIKSTNKTQHDDMDF